MSFELIENYKHSPVMTGFAAYLKEREGVELLETEEGFAIYVIKDGECYLRDIFVFPQHRLKGVASNIADQVSAKAKELGCKILTGSVSPKTNGATASLRALLGYGMRLHSVSGDLIFFIKEL